MSTQGILLLSSTGADGLGKIQGAALQTLNHPTSFQHKGTSLVLYWARCTVELTQYRFCRINDWVSFGEPSCSAECKTEKEKNNRKNSPLTRNNKNGRHSSLSIHFYIFNVKVWLWLPSSNLFLHWKLGSHALSGNGYLRKIQSTHM